MSAIEDTLDDNTIVLPDNFRARQSNLSKFVDLISSVRFGIILLILLLLACLIGMLIMQENVAGFERYYGELAPSQQILYGMFGLFDIYHSWYFNALLALLSLNIVLASFERFPKTWAFISNPALAPSPRWLLEQNPATTIICDGKKHEISAKLVAAANKLGWRKTEITDKDNKTWIFAQSGAWNRLGAYPVHVALLTIFLGGFLTAQFGFTGQMRVTPNQTSNHISESVFRSGQIEDIKRNLPFAVICTDLEQKLIKRNGSIEAGNTIDWLTRIQVKDEFGIRDAVVQLNRPFDYRGYRFFQASFLPIGKARHVTIEVRSENGSTENLTIKRDNSATLADGTIIKFIDFRANFSLAKENPNENTTSYQNPAAIFEITSPNSTPKTAYAFGEQSKGIPNAEQLGGGYTIKLLDFEKVSEQHVLSVQRDPGSMVVYVGFVMLMLALIAVFLFSHQRIWAVIEEKSEGNFNVTIGGHANRNQMAFEEKFERFVIEMRASKLV